MLRKPLSVRIVLVAVSCAAAAMVFAQAKHRGAAAPMPPERSADSYAIYSLLMPGDTFNAMPVEQNQRWAIADTTVSIADMNPAVPPEGQLTPPPDNPDAFRSAALDYQTRRYQHIQLTTDFHLDHPYTLMNGGQVAEFRRARTAVDAGSDLLAKYNGYPGITFFSQVFFNDNQTAALVYMNNWCANLCAEGQWVYLEKQGGSWVRRSGINAKP
jgi:hypothetical protein